MNEKIDGILEFFENGESWNKEGYVYDLIGNIKELQGYSADEISLEWDGEYLITLQEFIDIFFDKVINGVCNVLESFKE